MFAKSKDKSKVFSFAQIGGKFRIENMVDINKIPMINIRSNSITSYKKLFDNHISILYLRAISQLGDNATAEDIARLIGKLNYEDNCKLNVVYKDTESKIKNVTFGL